MSGSTPGPRLKGRRSSGEGSIFRRADGVWAGQLELEPGGDGRRRRRTFYGRTRRQVLEKIDRARADLVQGQEPAQPSRMRITIGEILDELLAGLGTSSIRPLTVVRTRQVIEQQIRPRLGRLPIARLDADRIEAWQGSLLSAGYAPRTVWKARSVLSAVIRLARRKRPPLLRENPLELVDPPAAGEIDRRALSGEEARRLLVALHGDRLETLFLAMLMLGLRRGEVLGLTWSDVDLGAGTLAVRQQVQRVPGQKGLHLVGPKSRAGSRVLPLPSLLADQLRAQRQRGVSSTFVFPREDGTPMDPRSLSRTFATLVQRAGVAPLTLHELRHSAATLLQLMGVPPLIVAKLLGHADPALALRVYGHAVSADLRQAASQMDAYIRGLMEADPPVDGCRNGCSGGAARPTGGRF